MRMTIKHKRLASMSVLSDEIRECAAEVSDNVVLPNEDGDTTSIKHYPDGRIEVDAEGNASELANKISNLGGYPSDVASVQE